MSGEHGLLRKHGFSWTSDLAVACSFATESPGFIFEAICHESEILCFVKDRDEEEFIVRPAKITQMELSDEEIRRQASDMQQRRSAAKNQKLAKLSAQREN